MDKPRQHFVFGDFWPFVGMGLGIMGEGGQTTAGARKRAAHVEFNTRGRGQRLYTYSFAPDGETRHFSRTADLCAASLFCPNSGKSITLVI